MSKELWIAAHEQLIEEYMDAHPHASYQEASDATADFAQDRVIDRIAAVADAMKDRKKDGA